MQNKPVLSVILPCQNEEKALDIVLTKIKATLKKHKINAEIIVSDSSTDKSPIIAKKHGVRLVKHDLDGYGNAYLEGIRVARGTYLFMADSDDTYDFTEIPKFLKYLEDGNQFVIGNRFAYKMKKGTMPFLHKYIGNPILSRLFNIFFRTKIKDVHCGMRAIKKDDFDALQLHTTGMEFASEMIVEVARHNYRVKQLPISYSPRIGESKLSTWRDGWRHLRFMLLYSPAYLFLFPGILALLLGVLSGVPLLFGSFTIFGLTLLIHPLFFSALSIIFGVQLLLFYLFVKTYSYVHLGHENTFLRNLYRKSSLGLGLATGALFIIISILLTLVVILNWLNNGSLSLFDTKVSIASLTLFIISMQMFFGSFSLSIIGIKSRSD